MDLHRVWLAEHREYSDRMRAIRNTIDAFGLIWFVVGNMWLFGDDNDICHHPERSPIYNLCLSLLVLNYMQICFPCIIAILLIPVFCFCMPCLIRVLARLQDPRTVVVSAFANYCILHGLFCRSQHTDPDPLFFLSLTHCTVHAVAPDPLTPPLLAPCNTLHRVPRTRSSRPCRRWWWTARICGWARTTPALSVSARWPSEMPPAFCAARTFSTNR